MHMERETYNAWACADSLTHGRKLRMHITFKSSLPSEREVTVCKEAKRKYRIRKFLDFRRLKYK